MKMHTRLIVLAAAMALSASAFAAQPAGFWTYPAIAGYGPVHVWPGTVLHPNAKHTYKALFDLTQGKADADKVNPGLDHVARTVNTFAAAGVPLSHMKFAVIIHGPATQIVLNEKNYMAKFGHANPNLAVIADLKKAGVNVMVCGNALGDMEIAPSEVNPDIKVALSALSTLVILQDRGYALMRM
jgi:intracellular sulfur oxidation DsrE/DsrF family protein